MAKRTIDWSHKAKIKLFEILEFYAQRNKNKIYSKRLYTKITKRLHLLIKYPEIGKPTDDITIKGLIVDEFILYYEITTDKIIVHTIWDCHQNPNDLIIK